MTARERSDVARWERQIPPGSDVVVIHGKPWARTVKMRGTAREWRDGALIIDRTFSPGGTYDTLNEPKLHGDHGTIEVVPGGRVLKRVYYRSDGSVIGELYNVQTPAQVRPGQITYTDLEIDVARYGDGRVEVVDEADLERTVRSGGIRPEDAEMARAVAYQLADLLSEGGDWREAA